MNSSRNTYLSLRDGFFPSPNPLRDPGSHDWRHTDWLQSSLDVAFQPQQQFKQRGAGLLSALASGTLGGGVSSL
jgi:hypothetical protein